MRGIVIGTYNIFNNEKYRRILIRAKHGLDIYIHLDYHLRLKRVGKKSVYLSLELGRFFFETIDREEELVCEAIGLTEELDPEKIVQCIRSAVNNKYWPQKEINILENINNYFL